MTNNKIIEAFRKRRVFNEHTFYVDRPYIFYRPRSPWHLQAWGVSKRNVKLSDHWEDNGVKYFEVHFSGNPNDPFPIQKKQALAQAMLFALQKFGVTEWAQDPFGSYGENAYVESRVAEILAAPEGTEFECWTCGALARKNEQGLYRCPRGHAPKELKEAS